MPTTTPSQLAEPDAGLGRAPWSTSASTRRAALPRACDTASASTRPSSATHAVATASVAVSRASTHGHMVSSGLASPTRLTSNRRRPSPACAMRDHAPSAAGSTPSPASGHSTNTIAASSRYGSRSASSSTVMPRARYRSRCDRPAPAARVAVGDGERRAGHRLRHAERGRGVAHEGRLAGAELAVQVDDVARRSGAASAAARAARPGLVDDPAHAIRTGRAGRARAPALGAGVGLGRGGPGRQVGVAGAAADAGRRARTAPAGARGRRAMSASVGRSARQRRGRVVERVQHRVVVADRARSGRPWHAHDADVAADRSAWRSSRASAITRGADSSTWRCSLPWQASISSGSGSRFPGGRHLSTLAM